MNLAQKIGHVVADVARAIWPFIGQTVEADAKAVEDLAADSLPKLKAGLEAAFTTFFEAKMGPAAGAIVGTLAASLADNAIHTAGVALEGIAASSKAS